MKVYRFKQLQYYEAPDFYDDIFPGNPNEKPSQREKQEEIGRVIGYFTRKKLFKELIDCWGERCNQAQEVLLGAHGDSEERPWGFYDGERRYAMQSWIDRRESEKPRAIFLCSCNRVDGEIEAKNAIVVHARRSFYIKDLRKGRVPLRIFFPGEGYLEDRVRRLKEVIDDLRRNGNDH